MRQIHVCIGHLEDGIVVPRVIGKPFKKGCVPWNKGKKGCTHSGSFKKGHLQSNTGRTHFKKGMTTWCKGTKGIMKPNKTSFKEGQRLSPKTEFKKGNVPWNKKGDANAKLLRRRIIEKYDINFNNKFKRVIRKRDNQVCMLCEVHREKLNKVLDVHHIDYNKLLSVPQNCISLCHSCHPKTNHNRKYWVKFFQDLLSDRYEYEYENQEIVLEVSGGKDCGAA